MTDAIDPPIRTTMDKAGRVVLPKAIREEAGFEPGAPLRISVREGRVEIEPVYPEIRIVERDGFRVAERVEPGPPLTAAAVRRTLRRVRDGRAR